MKPSISDVGGLHADHVAAVLRRSIVGRSTPIKRQRLVDEHMLVVIAALAPAPYRRAAPLRSRRRSTGPRRTTMLGASRHDGQPRPAAQRDATLAGRPSRRLTRRMAARPPSSHRLDRDVVAIGPDRGQRQALLASRLLRSLDSGGQVWRRSRGSGSPGTAGIRAGRCVAGIVDRERAAALLAGVAGLALRLALEAERAGRWSGSPARRRAGTGTCRTAAR